MNPLVKDPAAVKLLDKDVHFTDSIWPDIRFGVCHTNLDVFHGPHEIIHQPLPVVANDVDDTVRWRSAVVNAHLGAKSKVSSEKRNTAEPLLLRYLYSVHAKGQSEAILICKRPTRPLEYL